MRCHRATGFLVTVKSALDHVPPSRGELLCCRTAAWTSENFPRGISYKRSHKGIHHDPSVCYETAVTQSLERINYRCKTYKQSYFNMTPSQT